VQVAKDGLEGLGLCLKSPPDIILSDVQMPRMDGWQFLRMLRSRPTLKQVPVLFLTTLGTEEDRLRGYRLGVDDFLQKPYQPRDLLGRVDRAVMRSAQMSEVQSPKEQDAFSGDLQLVALPSVLSFMELERKTGLLRIGPQVNGTIYLEAGIAVHVDLPGSDPSQSDEERLYRLMEAALGRWDFSPSLPEFTRTAQIPLGAALMEFARRSDEAAR
jgi:CheY-like chemotaxis protein